MAAAGLPEEYPEARRGLPLNHWAPRQRRNASVAALAAGVFLLGFVLLAWQMFAPTPQTESFVLAVLGVLVLVLVFQLLVVVTGLRQRSPLGEGGDAESAGSGPWAPEDPGSWGEEAGAGGAGAASEAGGTYEPPPLAIPGPGPGAEAAGEPITLKCSNCATVFDVTDTGARPLRHACPGCGLEGELTEEDIGPAPGAAAHEEALAEPGGVAGAAHAGAVAPAHEQPGLTLKCGNCATVFDVTDTGARPLRHTCPGCGLEGELTEEDIGPAPEAAPPAPEAPAAEPALDEEFAALGEAGPGRSEPEAPARAAPAPEPAPPAPSAPAAPSKPTPGKVRALKLRCKNCRTVFTLRDTGERPLYHECPGCKSTGVLR